tara:strand:- start:45131 stop:45451 length:321 start_codon:yes stop_codon:yes gene_type:complete
MMMPNNNDDIFSLRTLAMERDLARQNLKQDAQEARIRFKPSNLLNEAKHKAADRIVRAGSDAISGIRANPALSATVAATATLIAMRKPIAKLIASRKISEPDSIEE